jgi:DNA (cytosine-5)-methyltransferase 3A
MQREEEEEEGDIREVELRYLSLFSGIGGFELALERAFAGKEFVGEDGARVRIRPVCVGFSEVDAACLKVYRSRFPDHPCLGSAVEIDGVALSAEGGGKGVDLVVGGPPCQDLTVANNFGGRKGLEGARSGLFYHYARLLRETGARWFVMENVARMKDSDRETITRELKAAVGDDGTGDPSDAVRSVVLDSALVSAQRRRRLFWTNFPFEPPEDRGVSLASVLVPVEEALRLEHSVKAVAYMDRAVADGRVKWAFAYHSDTGDGKSRTVTNAWHKGKPYNVLVDRRVEGSVKAERCPASKGLGGKDGTKEVAGRPLVRNFAPEEAERLQTFPDGWTDVVCKTERFRQIGNAVTVDTVASVLAWLGRRLASTGWDPERGTEIRSVEAARPRTKRARTEECGEVLDAGADSGPPKKRATRRIVFRVRNRSSMFTVGIKNR